MSELISIPPVDAINLEKDLRETIEGEVLFDDGHRALYATDASNYRQVPIGVIYPRDDRDVIHAVECCRKWGAPILSRGGGTSLAGQTCNVAVIMDMSRHMNRILDVDWENHLARVQPGVVLDRLREKAETKHLTFGPDPATHGWCTLGGMIGNNSCGVHSIMSGRTIDNIHELDILTYDGIRMKVGKTDDATLNQILSEGGRRAEIYKGLIRIRDRYASAIRERFPKIPRLVSGYPLDQLLPENGFQVARALVGTESTCVTILEATTRLIHSPSVRTLVVIGFPDIFLAADHVTEVLKFGPIGLEGMDGNFLSNLRLKQIQLGNMKVFPEGGGMLLVEFGGESVEESREKSHRLIQALKIWRVPTDVRYYEDSISQHSVWSVRESGLGASARIPGQKDNWEGWEDAAVAPEKLGVYLRGFKGLIEKYEYETTLYGHFGDGCVHSRIDFDFRTERGIKQFRSFVEEAADLTVKLGGSLSGEHGDGQARAELLPKMFGAELVGAFREFKTLWDPMGKMNPGKVVDPYRLDENLRLGSDYHPAELPTHFQFEEDRGLFSRVAERCVGVGKCRKETGGTMCPSYRVTREEIHSTRGRAHLLFEMLRGNPLKQKWANESVKEALDLCLACKGCKGECPVQVDMATYKAEFLSHYYESHSRPLRAYLIGWAHRWARVGSWFPGVSNFFTQNRLLASIAKKMFGLAPERSLPALAGQSFKTWFFDRTQNLTTGKRVMLWPDTFNNYFHSEVARSAVEVLEELGFQVEVPRRAFCCGRPLYDQGMLDLAKKLLQEILNGLTDAIEQEVPIIVLEPSCAAVFRDELVNLIPKDPRAQKLKKQVFLLGEFLEKYAPDYPWKQKKGSVLMHGHCHQKAVLTIQPEIDLLRKLGYDVEHLDSGCCGMAGGFGFEKEHYQVSLQCGEQVLLPRVRLADEDTLVMTNGFSCQEQIRQCTDRQPKHLAQVLREALAR